MATAANPLVPDDIPRMMEAGLIPFQILPDLKNSPIFGEIVQQLKSGAYAPNLGMRLGLNGLLSLTPLLAVIASVSAYFYATKGKKKD